MGTQQPFIRRMHRLVRQLSLLTVCAGILTPMAATGQSLGAEERNAIDVTRRATPAVVGIQTNSGSGSGVLIREDGVILTNAHVVGTYNQVRVSLADGSEFPGHVLGRDPLIDIAVVTIPGENLPAAPLADSDRIEVGQFVIAIGNPLGFDRTVTRGIVSGLNRALSQLDELIQTDAAINPGNSGGPLLNSSGEVIGINTAVVNPGVATGLGFAVPINLARSVADQLLTTGRIRRALLGIEYAEISEEMADVWRLPVDEGIIVTFVQPGTPAASAGLRRGDIITRINDSDIDGGGDLRRFLRQNEPGRAMRIEGYRGTTRVLFEGRLGEAVIG
jgi:serine protease Do